MTREVQAVDTANISATDGELREVALPQAGAEFDSLSISHLFLNADIVVQSVIFILVLCSIISWAIAFEKYFYFWYLRSDKKISRSILSSLNPLSLNITESDFHTPNHPIARMYNVFEERYDLLIDKAISLKEKKDIISADLNRIINRTLDKAEGGLNFLATTASAAPFIGLFGTVWGIMNSFRSIAVSKGSGIEIVAPGIAEALFATAIGLIAAIPAVILYNRINSKINNFQMELEDISEHMLRTNFDNYVKS